MESADVVARRVSYMIKRCQLGTVVVVDDTVDDLMGGGIPAHRRVGSASVCAVRVAEASEVHVDLDEMLQKVWIGSNVIRAREWTIPIDQVSLTLNTDLRRVVDHGMQRGQVAVYVRYQAESHRFTLHLAVHVALTDGAGRRNVHIVDQRSVSFLSCCFDFLASRFSLRVLPTFLPSRRCGDLGMDSSFVVERVVN